MIYRVLIVEDNKDLNEMFQIALADEKIFQTESLFDGRMALEKALKFKPNLILLDIMMPHENGYEVLKKLRQHPLLKKTIVVVNSNMEQQRDEDKALLLGADFYLRKSEYAPSQLIQKIKSILIAEKGKSILMKGVHVGV